MADDLQVDERTETEALGEALAAEHTAVWGYGVVGAALPPDARGPAAAGETAHRDARDRLVALLDERGADPVPPEAAYALPFPVLSGTDAAALAVVLEDGVAGAWVRVLAGAADREVRLLAVEQLSAAELRAVGWRTATGRAPTTTPFPGLPAG
ncbi:ferritin-like domain-containing protein [Blastococcus sp. SYSU D00669]